MGQLSKRPGEPKDLPTPVKCPLDSALKATWLISVVWELDGVRFQECVGYIVFKMLMHIQV